MIAPSAPPPAAETPAVIRARPSAPPRWPLLWLVLGLASVPAWSQDIEVSGDSYVLQFDEVEGERLEDFIHLAKSLLGRPIKYNAAELADTRIRIVGPQTVRRDLFFQYFQAVLKSYDFIVTEYGPQDGNFLSVTKVIPGGGGRGASFLKTQAPVVDYRDLEDYRDNPATLITTSIPLQYIEARNAMSALSSYFDNFIETIRNVENANNLIVTGFGTTVWGVYQLLQLMDVPPFEPQPVIRQRILVHASVNEINEVLTELINAAQGLRQGQVQPQQQSALARQEIEPRIIADGRTRSLLITGSETWVERIESWIDVLDVEVAPEGNTHVYRLKNANARAVQEVLQQVLEAQRQAQQQAAARQGGGQAGGGGQGEAPASVFADDPSNSLVITANERQYAEILDIIRELDVRRRQVLIEAAIVETTKSLSDAFAAEVAFAQLGEPDGDSFLRPFAATAFGLTTTTLTFDEDGNLTSATREPDLNMAGIQLGLFENDNFGIPLILQAIETQTATDVLSRPSILTNDNEEAFVRSDVQTSFETSTSTAAGITTTFDNVTAGIQLRISPTISAGNYLRLSVNIQVSDFSDSRSGIPGAPPDITEREIETQVTLPDAHTMILGGVVSATDRSSESQVPWFGDLPYVGWLFGSDSQTTEERYLYVFITPRIIDTGFARLDELSEARRRDYSRLGGDVSSLSADFSFDASNPDMRVLDPSIEQVFELPSVAVPRSGEREGPPPSMPDPNPRAAPPPRPAPERDAPRATPSFDDVFGTPLSDDG